MMMDDAGDAATPRFSAFPGARLSMIPPLANPEPEIDLCRKNISAGAGAKYLEDVSLGRGSCLDVGPSRPIDLNPSFPAPAPGLPLPSIKYCDGG